MNRTTSSMYSQNLAHGREKYAMFHAPSGGCPQTKPENKDACRLGYPVDRRVQDKTADTHARKTFQERWGVDSYKAIRRER